MQQSSKQPPQKQQIPGLQIPQTQGGLLKSPRQNQNQSDSPHLVASEKLTFDNLVQKYIQGKSSPRHSNEDLEYQLSESSSTQQMPDQEIESITNIIPSQSNQICQTSIQDPQEPQTIQPQQYQRQILNVIKLRDMTEKPSNPAKKPDIKQTLSVKKKQIENQTFQQPIMSDFPEKPQNKNINKWEEFLNFLIQICQKQNYQCQICQLLLSQPQECSGCKKIQNQEAKFDTILLLYALKDQIFSLYTQPASVTLENIDKQLSILDLLFTYLDQTLTTNETIMISITLAEIINTIIFNLYKSQDSRLSKVMEKVFKQNLLNKLQNISQKVSYSRQLPSNCLLYEYNVISTGLQLIPDDQNQIKKSWYKEMLTSAHLLDEDHTTTLQTLEVQASNFLVRKKGENQDQQIYKTIIFFESAKKKIITLLTNSQDDYKNQSLVIRFLKEIEKIIEDEQYQIKYGFTKLISDILQYRSVFTFSDIWKIDAFSEQEQQDLWAEMAQKNWIQVIDSNLKVSLTNYNFDEYLDYYKFNDKIQESVKQFLITQKKGISKSLKQFLFNGEFTFNQIDDLQELKRLKFKGICGYTYIPIKKNLDHDEQDTSLKKNDPISLVIKEIQNIVQGELNLIQNYASDSVLFTQKHFKNQLNIFWNLKLKNRSKKLLKVKYLFQDQIYKCFLHKENAHLYMDKGNQNFQHQIDKFSGFFKEIQSIVLKVQNHLQHNKVKITNLKNCIQTIFEFNENSDTITHAIYDLLENIQSDKLMNIAKKIEEDVVSLIESDINKAIGIFDLLLVKESQTPQIELIENLTLRMQTIYSKWRNVYDKKIYFMNKINQIMVSLDIINSIKKFNWNSSQLIQLKNSVEEIWLQLTNFIFRKIFKTYYLFLKDITKNKNLWTQKTINVQELKEGIKISIYKNGELKILGEQILELFSSISKNLEELKNPASLSTQVIETDEEQLTVDQMKQKLQLEFQDVASSLNYYELVINQIQNHFNQILIQINQNNYDQQYNFFNEIKEQIGQDVSRIFKLTDLSEQDLRRNIQIILNNHWAQFCREVETNAIYDLYNQITSNIEILAYFKKMISECQLNIFAKILKYSDEYSSELKPFIKQLSEILKSQFKKLFNINKLDFLHSKDLASLTIEDIGSDSDDIEDYDEDIFTNQEEENSQSDSQESDQDIEEKLKWFDDINDEKSKIIDNKQISNEDDEWKLRERAVIILFQIEQNNQNEEISKQVASLILQLRVKETDKRVLTNLSYKDNINHLCSILQRYWSLHQEEFYIYMNQQISDLQIYQDKIRLETDETKQKELIKHSKLLQKHISQQLENIDQIGQLTNQGQEILKTIQVNIIKLEIQLEEIEEEINLTKTQDFPEVKIDTNVKSQLTVLELLGKRKKQIFQFQQEREFNFVTIDIILKRFRNNVQVDEGQEFKLQNSFIHKLSKKNFKQKIGQIDFEQKHYENFYEGGLIDQFRYSDQVNSMLIHGSSGSGKTVCLQQFEYQIWQKTCLTSKDIYWQLHRLYTNGSRTRKILSKLNNLNINNILDILMESHFIDSKGFFLAKTQTLINDLFEAHLAELDVLLNSKGQNEEVLMQESQDFSSPYKRPQSQIDLIEKQFISQLHSQRYGIIQEKQRYIINMIIFEEIVFQKIVNDPIPIIINLQQAAQPQMNVMKQSLESDYDFQEGQAYKLQLMNQLGYIKIILLMKGYNNLPNYMQNLNIYDVNQIQNWVNEQNYHYPKQIYFCESKFLDSENYEEKFQAHINCNTNDYKASESYWEYEIQSLNQSQLEDYLILNFQYNVKQSIYRFYKGQINEEKLEFSDTNEKTIKKMFMNFWKQICKNKITKQYFQEGKYRNVEQTRQVRELALEYIVKMMRNESRNQQLLKYCDTKSLKILRDSLEKIWLPSQYLEIIEIAHLSKLINTLFLAKVFIDSIEKLIQSFSNSESIKERFNQLFIQDCVLSSDPKENIEQSVIIKIITYSGFFDKFKITKDQVQAQLEISNILERDQWFRKLENSSKFYCISMVLQSLYSLDISKYHLYKMFLKNFIQKSVSDLHKNGIDAVQEKDVNKFIKRLCERMMEQNMFFVDMNKFSKIYKKQDNWDEFFGGGSDFPYAHYLRKCIPLTQFGKQFQFQHNSIFEFVTAQQYYKTVKKLQIDSLAVEEIYNYYTKRQQVLMSKSKIYMKLFSQEQDQNQEIQNVLKSQHEQYEELCSKTVHAKQEETFLQMLQRSEKDILHIATLWKNRLKSQKQSKYKLIYYIDCLKNSFKIIEKIKKLQINQNPHLISIKNEVICSFLQDIIKKQRFSRIKFTDQLQTLVQLQNIDASLRNVSINAIGIFVFCKYVFNKLNFKNLNLNSCNIHQSQFYDCQFENINFSEADMSCSYFFNCQFTNCNLKNAILKSSNLKDTTFERCQMQNISLGKSKYILYDSQLYREELKPSSEFTPKQSIRGRKDQIKKLLIHPVYENIVIAIHDLSVILFDIQDDNNVFKIDNHDEKTVSQIAILSGKLINLKDHLLITCNLSMLKIFTIKIVDKIITVELVRGLNFKFNYDEIYNLVYNLDQNHIILTCKQDNQYCTSVFKYSSDNHELVLHRNFVEQEKLSDHGYFMFDYITYVNSLLIRYGFKDEDKKFIAVSILNMKSPDYQPIELGKLKKIFRFDTYYDLNNLEFQVFCDVFINLQQVLALDNGTQEIRDNLTKFELDMGIGMLLIKETSAKQQKVIDKFQINTLELQNKFGAPKVIKSSKANNLVLIGYQYGLIYKFSGVHDQNTEAQKQQESPNQVIKDIAISIINVNQFWLIWFLGTKPAQSKTLYNYKLQRYNIEYNSDLSIKNFQLLQQSKKHSFQVFESAGLGDNDIFHSELKIVQHPDLSLSFLLLYSVCDETHSKFLIIVTEVVHNLLAKNQGQEYTFTQDSEIFKQTKSLDIINSQFSDVRGDPSRTDTFIMTMRSRNEPRTNKEMISKIVIVNYKSNVVYKVINFDFQQFKQKINEQDMDFLYDQISNSVFTATEGLIQQWQLPHDSVYAKIQEANITKRTLLNTIEPNFSTKGEELKCTDILGLHPTQESVILYNIQELVIYQYNLKLKKITTRYQVEIDSIMEADQFDIIQQDSEIEPDRKQYVIDTIYNYSQQKKNYITELMLDPKLNLALIKQDLQSQIQFVLHRYIPIVFIVLKPLRKVVVYNLESEGQPRHALFIQTPFNTQSFDNSSLPIYNDLFFTFHQNMPNIVLIGYQSSLQIYKIELSLQTNGSAYTSPMKLERSTSVVQTDFMISSVYFTSFSQPSLNCSGLKIWECEIDEDTKKKFEQNNAKLENCQMKDLDEDDF